MIANLEPNGAVSVAAFGHDGYEYHQPGVGIGAGEYEPEVRAHAPVANAQRSPGRD